MKTYAKVAYHAVFYIVSLLVVINLGFIFNVKISQWDLLITYILYGIGLAVYTFKQRRFLSWKYVGIGVLVPIIFFFCAEAFGGTYDTSYDGQDYHQIAVISLANGWNPLKTATLPIHVVTNRNGKQPDYGLPFALSYPKALWEIQASIYKLTNRISSGAVTNLVALLIVVPIVYELLRVIGVKRWTALVLTVLVALSPASMKEFTSFMADGFIYDISVVGIASLIMLCVSPKRKTLSLSVLLSSILLLMGTKYSSLPIAIGLGISCIVYLLYTYKKDVAYFKRCMYIVLGFFVISLVTLSVPYMTNLVRYGTPLYPDNQTWARVDLKVENIPHNLEHQDSFGLLFYGIYSKAQDVSQAGSASSKANVADLKVPFTVSPYEITGNGLLLDRVAADGPLFSGLFTVSILIFAMLYFQAKEKKDKRLIVNIILVVGGILCAALLDPVPNKLIYTPVFSLIPICAVIALELLRHNKNSVRYWTSIIVTILIAANTLLMMVPLVATDVSNTQSINNQLATMHDSGLTYDVHVTAFYSTFTRLGEHNIKYVQVNHLTCATPQVLMGSSDTTHYCSENNA